MIKALLLIAVAVTCVVLAGCGTIYRARMIYTWWSENRYDRHLDWGGPSTEEANRNAPAPPT